MKPFYSKSLFLFRRDLRLEDNRGLNFSLRSSQIVIPAFIFTPEQIERNPYRGTASLQFMVESLEELGEQIREKNGNLYFFWGAPEEIVARCIRTNRIDAVVVNRDYTPYSVKRDQKIEATCKRLGVSFHSFDDLLLHPPEAILKRDGKPYTLFSPFFQKAKKINVSEPVSMDRGSFSLEKIELAHDLQYFLNIFPERREQARGGRAAALNHLEKLNCLNKYQIEKDTPRVEATSHLSPHLKFTTCSPREVYAAVVRSFGNQADLIRSLYWRDFFSSIAYFFPQRFGSSFYKKFDAIRWSYNQEAFARWSEGTTGFPIVDAGMRQLSQRGAIPNPLRMITASFLVKDLHIDWRWGEKHFARSLIDYDPAVNNGNWQWIAGSGSSAHPYFRSFNPWIQQKKFDPDCLYIKRWVPELNHFLSETIHHWHSQNHCLSSAPYPPPMLDHSVEAEKSLDLYKKAVKAGPEKLDPL